MNNSTSKENINTLYDSGSKLTIRTLGGTENVNKNLTVYEYGNDIILVDCGIGFPDIFDMPGVDIVIPDFSYLVENKHKIRGLFITHAHEDHIGALPYLLQDVGEISLYSGELVQEFVKVMLEDRSFDKSLLQKVKFNLIDGNTPEITLGNFKVSGIRVNHSIPETTGYAIKTPEGLFLHIAEYKFDDTPVLDKPIEVDKIERFGKEGVTCLLSDCLLVTTEGHTKSEKTLDSTFDELFQRAGKRQIFVTTMSSNISRMNQVASAAIRCGRKVVASGRSIEQMVKIARKLAYLPFPDDVFVPEKESVSYDQSTLVYIIAGCYGQVGSSLERLSRDENKDISLEDNAMVVFSGDPAPPGSDITVGKLTDALTLAGCEVIYSAIQNNLHVSGHAAKEDITRMIQLVKPKYFIPLGGTVTKMRAYKNLVGSLGFPKESVFECLEGEGVDFHNGKAEKSYSVETAPVYINTGTTQKINPVVVKDREILSNDGVLVVVVPQVKGGKLLADKAEVITRGFVYFSESQELMNRSKKLITKVLNKQDGRNKDWNFQKKKVENELDKFLYKETGRSPLIIVHALTI